MTGAVSLPSIHEMFPEHLMDLSSPAQTQLDSPARVSAIPKPLSKKKAKPYSFDVLRSDPSMPSLQHISSSTSHAGRSNQRTGASVPTFRVNPPHTSLSASASYSSSAVEPASPSSVTSSSSSPTLATSHYGVYPSNSSNGGAAPDDFSSVSYEDDDNDRRHVCTLCNKRFNRPSSLKIHMNTHTGATPFRCPYPGCGRSFNVNSNMRRHYRNHASASASSSSSSSSRSSTAGPSSPTSDSVHVKRVGTHLQPHAVTGTTHFRSGSGGRTLPVLRLDMRADDPLPSPSSSSSSPVTSPSPPPPPHHTHAYAYGDDAESESEGSVDYDRQYSTHTSFIRSSISVPDQSGRHNNNHYNLSPRPSKALSWTPLTFKLQPVGKDFR
ncbi:hypothetical protein D9758_014688 [Tetrapyrgos nigripes]|uniref:C2H2-type domain-containing protein n=1 Tax=Tetrapyrgos nigripes TaxID=182062 RepID=A0A8H5CKY5_9AGAR|nr:hypothetical protein D9758_014688 [Tetrapyrgos nigripes]